MNMRPYACWCLLSCLAAADTGRRLNYAMTDSNIFTARDAWLSNPTAAEATYGHISTWETSGVTDMSSLFCGSSCSCSNCYCSDCNTAAASFNEDIGAWDTSAVTRMDSMFYEASAFNQDIGAWDTSGVTTMYYMFYEAYAFNQDIGGWAVHNVKWMYDMFEGASAFNQDLGWCVDDGMDLSSVFYNTPCASTSCGVIQSSVCDYPMTDSIIRTAVAAWFDDQSAAEATYGHISTWETGGVTDMSWLFCRASYWADTDCPAGRAAPFNENIGAWDTSSVTDTDGMFFYASSFNQDISAWDTSRVTTMRDMFYEASAFDQDLGWCVGDGVSLVNAFYNTPCSSTSCGVVRCPTKENDKEQTPVAPIAGVAAATALLLAISAFYYYRRRKGPEPKEQTEAIPNKDEEATAVAPEAEESPQETLAEEPPAPPAPEGEPESPPFAPEAEDAVAAAERPPPPGNWFSRAAPEPEAEFEPEPEC